MKANCFIDYDGTLTCNKKRLYTFFIQNVPTKYKSVLSEEEFWSIKKLGINEIEWINNKFNDTLNGKCWNELKKQCIENEEYLLYNKLFDYTKCELERLKEDYRLILVSRRSNAKNLISEMEREGIIHFFDDIVIVPHDKYSKAEHIRRNKNIELTNDDIFIGDTEDDIITGIELNIEMYFVKSGIRSNWIISKLGVADYKKLQIINDIREVRNRRKEYNDENTSL
ncbi:MAG: family hydrolase [Clostridiaceae bacterium]|jgi:phosphoglycolate phosphatase-like HAD superfamily hydrolase|nr:family hydrolase [Clostridiaceae bacterium]